MKIEYQIDREDELIRVKLPESISITELITHFGNITKDACFDPSYDTLVTISYFKANLLSAKSLLHELITDFANCCEGTKWAVVFGEYLSREVIRLTFADLELDSVTIRCFMSESEAMRWLQN
jgi:hypothetical protein